ncbi:MAG: nonstructural protein [Microvirus sp.]|nr:MAG: nonstructural protein [Microvirus sp.]
MIIKMFSVRDNAVEAWLQPFFAPTTGAALRSLTEAVNDPSHQFAKHASDYTLWEVGAFDDATGILSYDPLFPVRVVSCIELVQKPN